MEPEGRDIHIDTIRDEVWQPRLPHGARARPQGLRRPRGRPPVARRRGHPAEGARGAAARHGVPAAVGAGARAARHGPQPVPRRRSSRRCPRRSSCAQLEGEGVDRTRALLAARLSGGNLGRARRMATDTDGLAFRDVAASALDRPPRGAAGALAAAADVLDAAAAYKKGLQARAGRGARPVPGRRRAGRRRPTGGRSGGSRPGSHAGSVGPSAIQVDRVLLAASSIVRDRIVGHGAGAARRAAQRRPGACPGGRCRRPGRVIGGAGGGPRDARR